VSSFYVTPLVELVAMSMNDRAAGNFVPSITLAVRTLSAFTLFELLVVMAIIAILTGLLVPGFLLWQKHGKVLGTQATVDQVLSALVAYDTTGRTFWSVENAPGEFKRYRLWDYNADQVIDGLPEHESPDPKGANDPLVLSGYRGLVAMTQVSVKRVDAVGRPLDAWGRPLRIAAALEIYGDSPFGVWSMGPDGLDGLPGTPAERDNVRSWRVK
jgi:prepilin-type N-terminal cleavage/methylation domain-containing protein